VQEPAQGGIAVQKGGFFVDVSPAFPKVHLRNKPMKEMPISSA
jgi:hypothetical protein